MKKWARSLSLIMAFVIAFSGMNLTAMATEEVNEIIFQEEKTDSFDDMETNYNQEDLLEDKESEDITSALERPSNESENVTTSESEDKEEDTPSETKEPEEDTTSEPEDKEEETTESDSEWENSTSDNDMDSFVSEEENKSTVSDNKRTDNAIIIWINRADENVACNLFLSPFPNSKVKKREVAPAIVEFKKENIETTPPTKPYKP